MNASFTLTFSDLHRALSGIDLRPALKTAIKPVADEVQDGLEARGIANEVSIAAAGKDKATIDIRYPANRKRPVVDELKRQDLADV